MGSHMGGIDDGPGQMYKPGAHCPYDHLNAFTADQNRAHQEWLKKHMAQVPVPSPCVIHWLHSLQMATLRMGVLCAHFLVIMFTSSTVARKLLECHGQWIDATRQLNLKLFETYRFFCDSSLHWVHQVVKHSFAVTPGNRPWHAFRLRLCESFDIRFESERCYYKTSMRETVDVQGKPITASKLGYK
jgi:hypothetical protein